MSIKLATTAIRDELENHNIVDMSNELKKL